VEVLAATLLKSKKMNKKQLATLSYQANQMNQQLEYAVDNLVASLEITFSTLATLAPQAALQVVQQLQQQVSEIENLIEERENDEEENIQSLVDNCPDVLKFD
jgi:CO dehydrogenase/acetyl-CoA synthase alpha subunit